jgi:lipopolysaccharide biosynthesis protein
MNHDITTAACATAAANQGRPIAIFVHVHFRDVWDEIASWIAQTIRRPFHLILTTSHTDGGLRMPEGPLLVSQTVIVTANRGRDVRPFLEALRTPVDYEIGLKLHTKRSTHRLEGGDWGRTLVQALLPGPEDVDRLVERMSEDRRLAIVAPDGMLVSLDRWMGSNRGMMRKAMARLSLGALESAPHPLVFCAGSMFWFRREALAPFRDNDLDDLFAAEAGQVDGTMAHALERLFAPVRPLARNVADPITTDGRPAYPLPAPAAPLGAMGVAGPGGTRGIRRPADRVASVGAKPVAPLTRRRVLGCSVGVYRAARLPGTINPDSHCP